MVVLREDAPLVDNRPDISICVVNWNGRQLLMNLLASIVRYRDALRVQTIVVDNASRDGSVEAVAQQFPEAVLVANDQNLGFSRANNQAASRANGKYLLFLNNDTVLREGGLQKLAEFLDQHDDVVAVAPKLIGSDGQPQHTVRALPNLAALLHRISIIKWTHLCRRAYRAYRHADFDLESSAPVAQVAAAAILVRREAFDAVGGWDEKFVFGVEDVDLCARLGRLGEIYYLAEAEIEHLGRVSSRANRMFVYSAYECGYARYLRKHHGGQAAQLTYKLLVTLDLPVRVVLLGVAAGVNFLRRRHHKAKRYWQRVRAVCGFAATGLIKFWRS